MGNCEFVVFQSSGASDGSFTQLAFEVADIKATAAALKARGVRFEEYDLPGLRTVGHVCVLGSEKAAWFEDPEGNLLCLHEDIG